MLENIVRHAHLPNPSIEESLCVSHLHVQDFYTAHFMLYAEVLDKGNYSVHKIVEQLHWLKCLLQACTLMLMLKSVL